MMGLKRPTICYCNMKSPINWKFILRDLDRPLGTTEINKSITKSYKENKVNFMHVYRLVISENVPVCFLRLFIVRGTNRASP